MLYLRGEAGEKITRTVSIVPSKKYPFKITGAKTLKKTENISFSLKEESGKGYTLTVKNIKKTVGFYFEKIILSTTSKQKPEIGIHVSGNIRKKHGGSDLKRP